MTAEKESLRFGVSHRDAAGTDAVALLLVNSQRAFGASRVLAMAYTCPDGFIPLSDAFMRALSALEDCTPLAHLIDEAITDDERDGRINKYDAVVRRVERLIRNAIADGHLQASIKAQNGQVEQLTDREEWRQEAFGVPGIDNVSHHLTNPGGDTDASSFFRRQDSITV